VQPTTIAGHDYVDGGLVSQVPVRIARRMGADIVIAVDVSKSLLTADQLKSTAAVMRQAMLIAMHRITEEEIEEADIIIRPDVGDINANDFDLRQQAVAAGEAAALGKIDAIKQLITKWRRQ
jgi:NTE family protein